MGDVAASGGYWISMDASEIWAQPTTITGSIGIYGLFFEFTSPGFGVPGVAGAIALLLGLYALQLLPVNWVGVGLLLSAAGDVLLELDGLFVGGMAAFGLAHVFYSAAFITIIRREGINRSGWPFAAAVLIASIALGVWFAPGQAAMGLAIPATAFSVIICVMVFAALMSKTPMMAKVVAVR